MDEQVMVLLEHLDMEINKKCLELQQRKRQAALNRLFVLLCIFLLIVPVCLVFIGVNLISILAPLVLFFSVGLLILSPVLFSKDMEEALL